jgi:hypothetical protein
MATRKPPELVVPGEPRKRVTRTTVTNEQLPEEQRDAPIEAWLADLVGDSTISYVRIWKRNGGRWGWLGKRNDILPPFDFDLDQLFQQYGDGEYRLVPYDTSGHVRGGRNELVQAGYPGTVRPNADGTTSTAPGVGGAGLDETVDLSELIRMERQHLILRNLRAAAGQGHEPAAYAGRDPGDDVERLAQLATVLQAMQPKPLDIAALLTAVGTILGPVLSKMLSPPDPADKMLGLVEKFLDIRERIEPGAGSDSWQSVVMRALGTLAESPIVRQALGNVPPAPVPALPAAAPVPALPAPVPVTATVPASPANGHPDAGSATRDADAQERAVLNQMVWPLVKRAALAGSDDYETYAALVDQQLPGFLEQWANADANQAMIFLGQVDRDVLTNVELQRWLLAFHTFVRTDFLNRDDADHNIGQENPHD